MTCFMNMGARVCPNFNQWLLNILPKVACESNYVLSTAPPHKVQCQIEDSDYNFHSSSCQAPSFIGKLLNSHITTMYEVSSSVLPGGTSVQVKVKNETGDFDFRGQEVFFPLHWTWDLWTLNKRCLRHLCRPDFSHLYQVNCCILVYHVWSCLCNVTSLLQSYSLTIFHVVCCLH